MSRLLSEASFPELMIAACKRLGRNEALVLVELEDDPSSTNARVIAGDEILYVPRSSIKAHGR